MGIFLSSLLFSGDLDDGIGIDSGIRSGNDLQKSLNVKYIIRKAKAKSANSEDGDGNIVGAEGADGTNVGGVNMVGGSIGGDVYIIQDIKGDVTTLSQ